MLARQGCLLARRIASLHPPTELRHPPFPRIRASLQNSPITSRFLHTTSARENVQAVAQEAIGEFDEPTTPQSSNPALSFPCIDQREARTATLARQQAESIGPEPSYTTGQHQHWRSNTPLKLDWGGILPEYTIAYETWGNLSPNKDNAILLHTGLSASSHAASTPNNPRPGWWEKFIGPGAALDTDKYFIICTNVLGGCYGSTGPSSIDPGNGEAYATRFPIVTMEDMVRGQFQLLDSFGINRLYASIGSSMGGMQSLAAGVLYKDRVGKIISVSGCARSHPYSIAMRHTQRQVLMMDPNWRRGFYYGKGSVPPHAGLKLAREIATVTYRSGPEWEERFSRRRADPSKPPALCPDFLIETYLDHAGEKFCLEYDANTLLYVSKAMDLFDLGHRHQTEMNQRRRQEGTASILPLKCSLTLPEEAYRDQLTSSPSVQESQPRLNGRRAIDKDLVQGLSPLRGHEVLVIGVASDILFPAWQQQEIAETLRAAGNTKVTHIELGEDVSRYGHDTFLLDLEHVGGAIRSFLD